MSTHEIEIVEIGKILPHPNAERLVLTNLWGWQCCIGKGDFKEGDKAIYVPPDYMCPTDHSSFSFLAREGLTQQRIRVRRFRGSLSQGLLIQVPSELANLPVGSNVIDQLGIKRYMPPEDLNDMFVGGPSGLYVPKFDVESYQRYFDRFEEGEEVIVTEKIHGISSRFTYAQDKDGEGKQFCGTRVNWVGEPKDEKDKNNPYWKAFYQCPDIGEWCKANPGKILYGEAFGQVKKFKYGGDKGRIFFAAFAILEKNDWLDFDDCQKLISKFGYTIPWVPLVYRGPFDKEKILAMAEGESSWPEADHIREGVVIIPIHERTDPEIGRVVLKMVSNRYLEKDDGLRKEFVQ